MKKDKIEVRTFKNRTEWYNQHNQLHRENGPAIEYTDGSKSWYKNGLKHREDGPAVEFADGSKFWYKNGQLHREDGPAIEYVNGYKLYARIIGNYRVIFNKLSTKIYYKNNLIILDQELPFSITLNKLKMYLIIS